MEANYNKSGGYGKRPMWQWVLIYLVIGGVIYGLVYYFVFAKKGGYNSMNTPQQQNTQQANPTVQPSTGSMQNKNTTSVEYNGNGFNPKSITVKVGDTVTWTDKDTDQVWVASNPHPTHTDYPGFDALKGISTGETYSFTFTKVGTWGYHNHLKPSEKGEVVVQQ